MQYAGTAGFKSDWQGFEGLMGRRGRETERLRERGMERGDKWQEAAAVNRKQ